MAATAGHKAQVRIGVLGDKTTRTDYELDEVSGSSGLLWAGGAERYIWDPGVPITVKINGSGAASGWVFDYLLGILSFDADQTGNTIEITGSTFDLHVIAQAHAVSVSVSKAMLESTVFGDEAVRRIPGLNDVTGTISRFETGAADYDIGAGSLTIYDVIESGEAVVLDIRPDSNGPSAIRCTALLESEASSSDVTGIQEAVVTFQGTLLDGATASASIGNPTA